MSRSKRRPKNGFVYLLHAIHDGQNIYKYGATTKQPYSRIKYARSRVFIGTDRPNNLSFSVVLAIKTKDIFYTEKMITWFMRSHNDHPVEFNSLGWPIKCDEMISCDVCLKDFFNDLIIGAVK